MVDMKNNQDLDTRIHRFISRKAGEHPDLHLLDSWDDDGIISHDKRENGIRLNGTGKFLTTWYTNFKETIASWSN